MTNPPEIPSSEVNGWVKPPLCVFCNTPWTDDMVHVMAEAELEYGYYGDATVESINSTVDITYSSCHRLIYRKEIVQKVGW